MTTNSSLHVTRFAAVWITLSIAACGGTQTPEADVPAGPRTAKATLTPLDDSGVSGEITFTEVEDGLEVSGTVTGLQPGSTHGFHIHEKGDCSSADASGGHFNPRGEAHGGLNAEYSHVGDLGNLMANEQGVAAVELVRINAELDDDDDILGRGVIVHAGADDLVSQPSGASGPRVACGVIEASGPR